MIQFDIQYNDILYVVIYDNEQSSGFGINFMGFKEGNKKLSILGVFLHEVLNHTEKIIIFFFDFFQFLSEDRLLVG